MQRLVNSQVLALGQAQLRGRKVRLLVLRYGVGGVLTVRCQLKTVAECNAN